MKIVVYRTGEASWRWNIVSGNKVADKLAVGLKWYTRKSDAKRGAERFEQKLFESYCKADEDRTGDGCMLPVEVID